MKEQITSLGVIQKDLDIVPCRVDNSFKVSSIVVVNEFNVDINDDDYEPHRRSFYWLPQ